MNLGPDLSHPVAECLSTQRRVAVGNLLSTQHRSVPLFGRRFILIRGVGGDVQGFPDSLILFFCEAPRDFRHVHEFPLALVVPLGLVDHWQSNQRRIGIADTSCGHGHRAQASKSPARNRATSGISLHESAVWRIQRRRRLLGNADR